ncbi:MAG TPA: ATP-binding protein [Candidatus Dormibacteraeota bacterium]|nr:ATP-binding protein [Candidatus Dormibacteraeota bacterium]
MAEIKRRERDAVLNSLQAGLVPRTGVHLIQVGRIDEVKAMLANLESIEQGGAAFRIVMGRFGSGKSFFLNLVRTLALQKRMVVVQADMTTERRINATDGKARALYSELMKNLAIKSKPDGEALRNLCEGWISKIQNEVKTAGGNDEEVKRRIFADLKDLQDSVGGFEFATVLSKYYEGYATGNDSLQSAALRWLRGEFTTKTEARAALDVRRIIDDENFYDSLKLLAAFCIKAGYSGLLVNLDEMVVLSERLPSARARQANYEAVLAMINDCLQGGVKNLGFVLGGTDEFVENPKRGLYSYEALRSRLAVNRFAGQGVKDFSGPVLRLQNLSPEELFVLLQKIRHIHAFGDESKYIVPDDALKAVLKKASETLGADYYKTPRDVIRSFVGLLNVLDQNPGRDWQSFLGDVSFAKRDNVISIEEEIANGVPPPADIEDNLATFKL